MVLTLNLPSSEHTPDITPRRHVPIYYKLARSISICFFRFHTNATKSLLAESPSTQKTGQCLAARGYYLIPGAWWLSHASESCCGLAWLTNPGSFDANYSNLWLQGENRVDPKNSLLSPGIYSIKWFKHKKPWKLKHCGAIGDVAIRWFPLKAVAEDHNSPHF